MKEKPRQNKLADFMEGKGFYLLLFLCVAAIGVSGYYLFSGLFSAVEDPSATAVSGEASITAPTQTATTKQTQTDESKTQAEQIDQADAQQDTAAETAVPEQEDTDTQENTPDETAAASLAYQWPVEGEIARDFSLEVFAYDATMGDWRTHDGIDIIAEVGTPVSACAKGTVTEVATDDMMGTTVTVDHGLGMVSVYSNLAPSLNVQVGTEVEGGSVLGTVGTSAIAESADPAHLHFTLEEYGTTIDPQYYLH
jgi:murein DD-endopeptidase MepM/ murein hydrolase activator NlpD